MARFRAGCWLLLALVTVTLSACSGGIEQSNSSSSATGEDSFPAKVKAANGTVTIPHKPQRIVSLSATASEDLYAVGAGGQLVAVDSYSTYPPEAPRTMLSGYTPNVEAIAGYRPDLVVVAEDTNHIVTQLGKLHVPALVEPPARDLNAAYGEIEQLGQATGHPEGARRAIAKTKDEITTTVASVSKPNTPLSVYHELDQTYYSATSQTFIGQIYTLLGLRNIADQAKGSGEYPQLSAEYVIAADPDLIVLADTVCCKQSVATLAARPGWGKIGAVRNGDVVSVDDSIASQWGPRIVLFVRRVAHAVERLEEQRE
jgi:iron complex transport system substrate-binding protein